MGTNLKRMIVSGDSCTEAEFWSNCHPTWDFNYPKWPEYVAEHFGLKLINLARGGQGNQYIYHTLLEEVTNTPKEDIGLVMAGWSQCHRKDYETGWMNNCWHSKRVDQDGDLLHWVSKTLRHYLSFQIMCERYSLPYYHFQMGDLFECYLNGLQPTENDRLLGKTDENDTMEYPGKRDRDEQHILGRITSYDPHIKNFIGWPGLQDKYRGFNWQLAGKKGFTMHDQIIGKDRVEIKRRQRSVSELDDHPNKEGHKAMADFIIGQMTGFDPNAR
jgi:hypothetical protein|tara:strand:+ start:46 stop:864 length:819 start_codon:yes stop_codon:yes gene_type:complete